jgi:hypothetical protein
MFRRLDWANVDPVAISGQYVVAKVPGHETRGQTSDSALSRRVFNAAFGSESESR